MIDYVTYALMAGDAYISTRAPVNQFPVPEGWAERIDQRKALPSGFEATYFTNGAEIVISYAGTGPGLDPDWVANCALALGAWSDQLGEAAAYYLQVKAANPPGTIISFTGHSLGGGLAALMSVFFGGTSMTFDQAPFAASATIALRDQLVTYLEQHGYTAQQLADVAPALVAPDFNPAARALNVTGISVSGEFLSLGNHFRIGLEIAPIEHAPGNWFLSSIDMHSQALLSAFGQNDDFRKVTFKLPDLLEMVFDKNLFYNDPSNKDAPLPNLLERLVRHQAGNAPGVVTADAMLDRFTTDLQKIAQDGGLTLADANMAQALTAFAMQMYYENPNAMVADKELFSQVSGGIRFNREDVAASLDDAKGYGRYFLAYLQDNFTGGELGKIMQELPSIKDWYIQAGSVSMGGNALSNINNLFYKLGGAAALKGEAVNDANYGNTAQPQRRTA